MAVDAAGLAAALGITVADPNDDTDTGIVEAQRLLDIAGELVDAYLRGGEAPEAIRDEAVIRTAGHVKTAARSTAYGTATGRMKVGSVTIDRPMPGVSAVRQSGAAALLAPWVRRTA